jgi:PAT family beta-lactamase induction signal transducer AmpG
MIRWGLFRSLLTFALAQAVTNLGFVLLALVGKSTAVMICVVVFENLFGGMGTAALVALLIALCDKRYTATQFALLSAIASLGRVLSGPFAGNFVAATGWTTFFIASLVIAIPGIILIVRLRRTIESVDQSR